MASKATKTKAKKAEPIEIEPKENTEFILFPGESLPYSQDLLAEGNYYLDTANSKLISKTLSKVNKERNDEFLKTIINQGNYYKPSVDDMVLGVITNKNAELYKVDINSYSDAILGTLEFEGASKKTKPNLKPGELVFAKVMKTNKFDAPMLTCISEGEKKNWASGEAFFGPVSSGYSFKLSLRYVNHLINHGEKLFSRLSDATDYEHNIGMNGYLWINARTVQDVLKINEIVGKWCEITFIQNLHGKFNPEILAKEIELLINKAFNEEPSSTTKK